MIHLRLHRSRWAFFFASAFAVFGCGSSSDTSTDGSSGAGGVTSTGSESGSNGGVNDTGGPGSTDSSIGSSSQGSTTGGSSQGSTTGGSSQGSTTGSNTTGSGSTTTTGANGSDGGTGIRDGGTSDRDAGGATAGDASDGGRDAASDGALGCSSTSLNQNPFGCKFAWGLAAPGGSLGAYNYLQFMTYWVESNLKADGTFTTCSGCNWLKNSVAPTNLIPVYYGYMIGFLGHANGFVDGNQCPSGMPNCPNLTNNGAELIKANRSKIVQLYADYAKQTHAVWPSKPLVWLLEGDFVQYAGSSQSSPLTMDELARLAADITCAIKANMPNAVVALDHSTWNPDQTTDDYWNAMKRADVAYDMVWTTGVANNNDYFTAGVGPKSYNGATATYSYVHQLTGRTILVDDGCGAETQETWSRASASTLNMRIASGVVAFTHCGTLESNYQSAIATLEPQLNSTCH